MNLKSWVNKLLIGNFEGIYPEMSDFLNQIHNNDRHHEFHGMSIDEVEIAVSDYYDLDRGVAIFSYASEVINRVIKDVEFYYWEYSLLKEEKQ